MKLLHLLLPPLLLFFLICGCAKQVEIPGALQPDDAACTAFFPAGTWHMVHTIEADLPLGKKATIIGVTAGDSVSDNLRVTGMSIEGMTLFDVLSCNENLKIISALPPMDNRAFLKGLIKDIRFLFFQPNSTPVDCVWTNDEGKASLSLSAEGTWTLTQTNDSGRLLRKATLNEFSQEGFTEKITLEVFYPVSYSLRMSLLDSGPLDSSIDPFSP